MDLASIIGLSLAFFSLIAGFMLEGGHASALVAPTAALIVLGGTFGATVTAFSMQDIKQIPKLLKIVFTNKSYPIDGLINTLVDFAEKARREGLLILEREIANIDDDFIRQGIQLVVDGNDPQLVRDILETQIDYTNSRHRVGAEIFEAAGGFGPTFGIIGTVMGLVHVLGNLSDPDSLGPAIAMAFLATLYGVASANVLFIPWGNKLKLKSKQEQFYKTVALEGILSLQAGDKPVVVRDKLRSFVSAKMRDEAGQ